MPLSPASILPAPWWLSAAALERVEGHCAPSLVSWSYLSNPALGPGPLATLVKMTPSHSNQKGWRPQEPCSSVASWQICNNQALFGD